MRGLFDVGHDLYPCHYYVSVEFTNRCIQLFRDIHCDRVCCFLSLAKIVVKLNESKTNCNYHNGDFPVASVLVYIFCYLHPLPGCSC